ncbi:MAG: TetR family transcriptional regulator C-terminal domain-containing protein, partial [Clostridiales Family XIII bacterium]|jgi:hypothetical protein|nr:TetR family transcriptional regulator C-terminal domain-containing protein [Clostridiales Family XIII bacterium]
LTYIKQNKEIFLLLSGKKGDLTFFRRLQQMMRTVILEREFDARLKIPASYAVAFISGAFSGIIGEWLAGGLKDPPEMLAQMISTIMSTLPKGIMVMQK